MKRIIVVDFGGTLVPPTVLDKANELRAQVLKRALPNSSEHANSEQLYKANREFVSQLTGITEDMQIAQTDLNLDELALTGEHIQTQIATTLFQIGMYMTAKELSDKFFAEGMIQTLTQLKEKGFSLAIVSGVRTDIISGILAITKNTGLFDYIYGQPNILGVSNEENLAELSQEGGVEYVIGDKKSDLTLGEHVNAHAIYVTWGHPTGGEEEVADYTVSKAEEIVDLIK
jgi:phosphoglycolate phosphatase-like HAD superfamily hydrolase